MSGAQFSNLPFELRRMIYERLCPRDCGPVVRYATSTANRTTDPALPFVDILNLAMTCKTIFVEAAGVMYSRMTVPVTCSDSSPLSEIKALSRRARKLVCPATHISGLRIHFTGNRRRKICSYFIHDDTDNAAVFRSTRNLPTVIKYVSQKFTNLRTLMIQTPTFFDLFHDSGVPHDFVLHPLCCALPRLRSVVFVPERMTIRGQEADFIIPPYSNDHQGTRSRLLLLALSWVITHNLQRPIPTTMSFWKPCKHCGGICDRHQSLPIKSAGCKPCDTGELEFCSLRFKMKNGACPFDMVDARQHAGQIIAERMERFLRQQMGIQGKLISKPGEDSTHKSRYNLRSRK